MGNELVMDQNEEKGSGTEIYISRNSVSHRDSESKAKARQKAKEHRDVIITPAIPVEETRKQKRAKLRIGAYCRVSTPTEAQVSSIENQIEYFTKLAEKHDDWGRLEIFADEGISGTNRRKRKDFNRMIDKAMAGELDYLVVKDVPRFARNTTDAITIARELRSLDPPVPILFDAMNFDTLREDWEILLTVMAMTSQMESGVKSAAMLWSYKHRFEEGRLLCPTHFLLGYTTTDDGQMVIVEDEAHVIRIMYSMLIAGYSPKEIAGHLTESGIRTGWHSIDPDGNTVYNTHWTASSVCSLLRNEKYMGACKGQKTFTVDYVEHKRRINKGRFPTYYIEKHHDPIVTKEVWELAQKILTASAYLRKGKICRSELAVMKKGLLRGFVPLNAMHAGFDLWDYFDASEAGGWDTELKEIEITGPMDFQVLRSEFATNQLSPQITIDKRHINFNLECNKFFDNDEYIEILLHPSELLVAIRSAAADNPNAIRWSRWNDGKCSHINPDTGTIPALLYDLMNWNEDWKFKAVGCGRKKDNEAVMIFDLIETAAYIPKIRYDEDGNGNQIGWLHPVFPKDWEGKVAGDTLFATLTKCRMHLCDFFDEWDVYAAAEKAGNESRKDQSVYASREGLQKEIDNLRQYAVS